MALVKTEAVILHSRKQGETSKLVTFYSRHYGKLVLVAKGSRSVKSHYMGVLEPYQHVAIIFYLKENRSVYFLSQAEIIASFPSIHATLGKMALAAIPCEIIEKTEVAEHVCPELYNLLVDVLQALENARSGHKNIIRAFHLKFLHISGFKPALDSCERCGKEDVTGDVSFALDKGVYHCDACGRIGAEPVLLSPQALITLRWYAAIPVQHAAQAKIAAATGDEVDAFLIKYLRIHMEGLDHLNSLKYLQQLQKRLHK